MLLIRPVTMKDHPELLALAREAGIGMTSLPADSHVLDKKIARAEASFSGAKNWAGNEAFLFVLEDTASKKLAGTTGVIAHVGLRSPFYSYKLSTIVQASKDLGVYTSQRVLHMVNDYTAATEIGSLFLTQDYRRDGIGRFLSRSRYLLIAEFPTLFSEMVISEIRGQQDAGGESPFFKHLAQHFLQMPFPQADFIHATQGGQFISDLMPKYPIYVNLLESTAQAAIGKPLHASLPAMQMLEAEGFRYQGYVDVFDAGPTLQTRRDDIRTVRKSKKSTVTALKAMDGKASHMVSNTALDRFRMAMTVLETHEGGVTLDTAAADALGVKVGDAVRWADL